MAKGLGDLVADQANARLPPRPQPEAYDNNIGKGQALELDDQTGKDDAEPDEQHWGYHLLIDCSKCNDNINSNQAIGDFFDELVAALKMKKLGGPTILPRDGKRGGFQGLMRSVLEFLSRYVGPILYDVSETQGRGVTAFQPIDTSHISIHSDDDEMSAYIDVFSCAPYDPHVAIDCVQKWFAPKHLETLWIHRDAGKWPER